MGLGTLIKVAEHGLARTAGQAIGDAFTVDKPAILSGTALFSGAAKLTLEQVGVEGASGTVTAVFNDDANLTAGAPYNFTYVLRPGVSYQLKTTGGSITVTVTAQVTFGAHLSS